MSLVYSLSAIFFLVFILVYITGDKWKQVISHHYFMLVVIGLIAHYAASKINISYENDVNCFKAWSNMLFEHGFQNFYLSDTFTDYPPGYMYILYGLAFIRSVFGIGFDSGSYTFLIKLPAILCDILTALFIYKVAFKKLKPNLAFLISCVYLLNPAIIINSAVWGQVDSVYTLIVLVSIYALTEKKYIYSCLLFGFAVLIKPQAVFFTPIFLFAAYDLLVTKEFNKGSVMVVLKSIFSSVVVIAAGILPFAKDFNFRPIIQQYADTINSYPNATLNAYNFYSFIGANWAPVTDKFYGLSYTVWGLIFIDIIVLLSLYLLNRNSSKSNYFFVAALINTMCFMFSMRMHERYLFPTLIFLLVAYVYKREKKFLPLYVAFSITLFINCCDVLRMIANGNDLFYLSKTINIVSAANLILTGVMLYTAFSAYKKNAVEVDIKFNNPVKPFVDLDGPFEYERTVEKTKLVKIDFIIMIAFMLVYGAVAFFNLGNMHSPQTVWAPDVSEKVSVDLGSSRDIFSIQYMNGARNDKSIGIAYSEDGNTWISSEDLKLGAVFAWGVMDTGIKGRYLELTSLDYDLMVQELVFRDDMNQMIPISSVSENGNHLFDEQNLVPDKSSYKNSTYFDEIYHARTAYEFIHHLPVYEWTHPPLGKVIISIGIRLFGMTPFGWRFAGTLFGVFMIPLIYVFGKKLFNSTFWAFFAALIFTFDFMHFAQTRISTIDTYVTFFIIGMYYFMYEYYTMSFYDRPLTKTWIPLGLSGVFFGLAVASKWPGLYAGAGLAVLFFYTLFVRFREYVYALEKGDTEISGLFVKNTMYTIAFCCVFFIAVPLVIYYLSYIPFLQTPNKHGIASILENQTAMYSYHAHLTEGHAFSSQWWKWPFMIRPIFYYVSSIARGVRPEYIGSLLGHAPKEISYEIKSAISSFGNPAVWWCGVVAFFYSISALSKKYNKLLIFLLIAFFAQYLPWVLISRTTYIYHFFPSVPFIVMMIAYLFKEHFYPNHKNVVYMYLGLVILLFIMYYPVLSGLPISVRYVDKVLKWLATWQLI